MEEIENLFKEFEEHEQSISKEFPEAKDFVVDRFNKWLIRKRQDWRFLRQGDLGRY